MCIFLIFSICIFSFFFLTLLNRAKTKLYLLVKCTRVGSSIVMFQFDAQKNVNTYSWRVYSRETSRSQCVEQTSMPWKLLQSDGNCLSMQIRVYWQFSLIVSTVWNIVFVVTAKWYFSSHLERMWQWKARCVPIANNDGLIGLYSI